MANSDKNDPVSGSKPHTTVMPGSDELGSAEKQQVTQEYSQQEILKAYRSLASLEDSIAHLRENLGAGDQGPQAAPKPASAAWGQTVPLRKDDREVDFLDRVDTRKVSLGVKRHLWFILLCGLVLAAVFSMMSYTMLRAHQADAILLYTEHQVPGQQVGIMPSSFSRETIVEMIRMPQHFQSVRAILGLDLSPKTLAAMVDVETQRASNLIRITAQADNPNLAIDVANSLARVAVATSKQRYQQQAQNAYEYFKKQEAAADRRVEKATNALSDFKRETGVVEMHLENEYVAGRVNSARRMHQQATLQYDTLAIEFENLQHEIDKMPESVVRYEYEDSPLKGRIAHRELALIDAKTRYGPDNPKVQLLEEEVRQLRQAVSDVTFDETTEKVYEKNQVKEQLNVELLRMQAKLRAAKENKERLGVFLGDAEAELEKVPEEQAEYASLVLEVEDAQEELATLGDALREAENAVQAERSDVSVYQLAEEATAQGSFTARFLPTFGFILGSAFGLLFVLAAELRDKKLRTGRQIRNSYNVPYLISVPEISGLNAGNAEKETLFFIRNLAERLARQRGGEGFSSVVFTSATAGEGKSTLAYHLACYYKRLGLNPVYVHFDHHANPFMETRGRGASIEDYLKGSLSVNDLIIKGQVDALAAGYDPSMKELIKSEKMKRLWDSLTEAYDIIVVDAPGIVEDDYAVNIAAAADVLLYVIGSNKVTKNYVDASLQELEDLRIQPTAIVMTRMHQSYIEDPRIRAYWKGNRWFSSNKDAG